MDGKKNSLAVCMVFAVALAGGFLLCMLLPKEEYSLSERRRLAPMPEWSAEDLWSGRFMSRFEDYAVDGFPFREAFRRVKALTATRVFQRQDNHGVYETGGYLAAFEYPLKEDSLERALGRFRYIQETYLGEGNQAFLSVIPDKGCFLAPRSGRPCLDYGEMEKIASEKADFAEYIKISDLLEAEDYYRTDTHWRQEKLIDVARRLAEGMGTKSLEDYTVHTLEEDFYGVYYGQAALPASPDTIQYLTWEGMEECQVYDFQNSREMSMYDLEKAKGRDPYEMFLSGSLSLIIIENPGAKTGKKLALFRDSFGSSLAPLLAVGYDTIILADIRYIHPDHISRYVDLSDCDMLFLYSTLVLNHSDTIK
ncbi:MAG: hypothetical protein HFI76_04800 [Lachnospiraceae bacterium]|nr:hypothetical protein [Lachnospiraceae bacterium]